MAELPLYDKDGNKSGTIPVDEKLFGDIVRKKLLHQVVVIYEGNRRQGTASAKTRSEVAFSTRKPWPQKHTGMARAGTRRSPIWRHGGTTFGPRPRNHRRNMTVKMRRVALDSALLGKIRDGQIAVIQALEIDKPKTAELAKVLKATGLDGRVLIGVEKENRPAYLSARNLPDVSLETVGNFNAYEVLRHRRLLLTQDALSALVEARKKRQAMKK